MYGPQPDPGPLYLYYSESEKGEVLIFSILI